MLDSQTPRRLPPAPAPASRFSFVKELECKAATETRSAPARSTRAQWPPLRWAQAQWATWIANVRAWPAFQEHARFRAWVREQKKDAPGWVASFVLHATILALLWQTFMPPRDKNGDGVGAIVARLDQGSSPAPSDGTEFIAALERAPVADLHSNQPAAIADPQVLAKAADPLEFSPASPSELALPTPVESDRAKAVSQEAKETPPEPVRDAGTGGGKGARTPQRETGEGKDLVGDPASLSGRGADARAKLVKAGGGNEASEKGVELGLKWLARHQRSDGSWSFQHGPDDPGVLDCPTGATGLALLAFLGAGYTHEEGKYQQVVSAGLKFLTTSMQGAEPPGWLQGTGQATMYVQGIGTIALCEAYALTKDPNLKRPAQLALDFIIRAQDPDGGGWRYRIPQAGDTSVLGWQLMALKSAKIAGLEIPSRVIPKVTKFLKSVDSEGGAAYAYNRPGTERPSMTAVGLLCRMYLGRDTKHRGMIRGMKYLSDWGPNPYDMYYSYYATQAMHHWGGPNWEKWNPLMRDHLVNSQAKTGESAGSWPTDESHGAHMGGRLYTTCLSIMTLEVYYRYLPLYKRQNVSEDF